jgi:hypothetical protein
LPHLVELYQKHKERGLQMVLVSQESLDVLRAFVGQTSVPFPVLSDPTDAAFGPYRASAIPRTALVSREGALIALLPGYQEEAFHQQFVPLVEEALGLEKAARFHHSAVTSRQPQCRGVFGAPKEFWEAGKTLGEAGIDALFVAHGAVTEDLIARCRAEGAKVYAEFGVFQGKKVAEARPELWPIGPDGKRLEPDGWYLGLCPDRPEYRAEKLAELKQLVERHDVAGVWLDFIRYPGHWEVRSPRLVPACFCDESLRRFARAARLSLPEGGTAERAAWVLREHADAWTRWKCGQIAAFCRDAKALVKAARPKALVGAFVVPWRPEERQGAIRRVLGQDFARMARYVDVFSPMVYHRMVGRPVEWVGEIAAWMGRETGRPVWPIVQAVDAPQGETVAPEELVAVLRQALEHGDGALVFTLDALMKAPEKLDAVARLYRARRATPSAS